MGLRLLASGLRAKHLVSVYERGHYNYMYKRGFAYKRVGSELILIN